MLIISLAWLKYRLRHCSQHLPRGAITVEGAVAAAVVPEAEEDAEEHQDYKDHKAVIECRTPQLVLNPLFRLLLRRPLKVHHHQYGKRSLNVVAEVAVEGEMGEVAQELVVGDEAIPLTW